jgi:hypothetical protein
VEPRQIISSGIAASAIVHLSVLMLLIFFAEVHPFGTVTAEPIAVDIVSPQEVAEELKPLPDLEFPKLGPPPKPEIQIPDITDLPKPSEAKPPSAAKSAAAAAPPPPPPPPAAASQSAARSQKQAAAPQSAQQQAAAQPPQPQPQPPPPPPPQQSASMSPIPAPIPQEPDVSVKYHVLLGLPPGSPADEFDAPASKTADIASGFIAEFRQHLKTCSKLPQSISPSDDIKIKMRISMAPDGKLSAEPVLIEASASMKGPALMRGAIDALQACQPYAMLPPDKYGEWKRLDLVFTPQDFTR